MARCSSGAEAAMVSGWAETDGKWGFLKEAFNNFFGFPKVTFGGSKDSDGADAELKEPGALASTLDQNTNFGAGAQKWSAKEIASKPCRRTAWQGLVVMWLDTLSRVARFGLLFRSRVTHGMVQFLMQPAGSADCEEWWSLEKSLQGIASYKDHVTMLQANGSDGAVDLFHMLRDVSKETSGSRTNPRDKLQASDEKDLDRILEEAARRSAGGAKYPLGFHADGIKSGADQRTLLLAVNLGGREGLKVVNSEVMQSIIQQVRVKLDPKLCQPSDADIVHFVFGSKRANDFSVFNKCNKLLRMTSATPTKQVQQLQSSGGGEAVSTILTVDRDDRKRRSIATLQDAHFANMRWFECLEAVHGPRLARQWWISMAQMQDDLLAQNCASEAIRPETEVWASVWKDLPGQLFRAARSAEATGVHAGCSLAMIDIMPEQWALRRSELVMDLKLEWMQDLATKVDTVVGSSKKGARLSESDLNAITRRVVSMGGGGGGKGDGNGNNKGGGAGKGKGSKDNNRKASEQSAGGSSEVSEALKAAGFKNLFAAKSDWFGKDDVNRSRCWWACSPLGKSLGGCTIADCKFKDTHKFDLEIS